MRLWRLTRKEHQALDGEGAVRYGGRYSSPGQPIVSFASEAGLAVLVALRYRQADLPDAAEYVLGWTDTAEVPDRLGDHLDDTAKKDIVDRWAASRHSLLIAVRSAVLPEADIILMNALHRDARHLAPLTVRPFSFEDCLHPPPMLEPYRSNPS